MAVECALLLQFFFHLLEVADFAKIEAIVANFLKLLELVEVNLGLDHKHAVVVLELEVIVDL